MTSEIQKAFFYQNEEKIFAILRELERGQMSSYELVRMGYSLEIIDLLSRIRNYILKSLARRQLKNE